MAVEESVEIANKALVLTLPARGSFSHNCPP